MVRSRAGRESYGIGARESREDERAKHVWKKSSDYEGDFISPNKAYL